MKHLEASTNPRKLAIKKLIQGTVISELTIKTSWILTTTMERDKSYKALGLWISSTIRHCLTSSSEMQIKW